MTERKRIALNIVATYGRSLLSVVLGIFSGRWILMALGDVDFGLLGVVGGMTAFITFVNSMLSASISRFYAYSIGKASVADDQQVGLEECRKWFNTAVLIHTSIPCFFMLIGYPVGEWAVHHFLNIPPDRVAACAWVWRYACIVCLVGMINVPFSAMYGAKQYIAEMTVYGMARTMVNFVFIYFMASHPGGWLAKYAAWTCFVGVAIDVLICMRAIAVFPECRFRVAYLWRPECLKSLGVYSGWQMFSSVGLLLRGQGVPIFVNKLFGAGINASMSMANVVGCQTQSLAGAMRSAFQPVITQACGAGELERMRKLAFQSSRINVILALIFILPLLLEVQMVMKLWLVNPPYFAAELCVMFMLATIIDQITFGHIVSINAYGDVAVSQMFEFGGLVFALVALPLSYFAGLGLYAIGVAAFMSYLVMAIGRVYCAKRILDMPITPVFSQIVLPVCLVAGLSVAGGSLTHVFMDESVIRIGVTTGVVELLFLPLTWVFLLDAGERLFVRNKAKAYWEKATGI